MTDYTDIERAKFGERLRQSLKESGRNYNSATILRRELAVIGVDVTVCAARKWLLGEGFPTQGKLVRIAHWLGKNPDWLRYGVGNAVTNIQPGELIDPATLRAMHGFGQLAERDQLLVQGIIDNMLQTA